MVLRNACGVSLFGTAIATVGHAASHNNGLVDTKRDTARALAVSKSETVCCGAHHLGLGLRQMTGGIASRGCETKPLSCFWSAAPMD